MWMVVCALLLGGVLLNAGAPMTTEGDLFLVVFLEDAPNSNDAKMDLLITTLQAESVEVRISAPLRPDIGPEMTVHVTREAAAVANIHPLLHAIGTGICDHGVLVESESSISVQAYTQSMSESRPYSSAGFRVFPVASLGFEYMVLTHCEVNFCMFAVAAVNDTDLYISIKLALTQSFIFNDIAYYNGDTLRCTLKAYQVLQIKAPADLSGTIIKASEKVAVIVGSDYTTIHPFKATSEGDFLMEQMASINRWGWTYVLASFPGRVDRDLVNVLAAEEDVVVTTASGGVFSIGYRSKVILDLFPNSVGYFTSTGRVIVAHFTKSPANKDDDNTDPSMILVPPVEQWSSLGIVSVASLPPTVVTTSLVLYAYSTCNVTVLGVDRVSWIDYVTGVKAAVITTQDDVIIYQAQREKCTGVSGYIYAQSYAAALSFPVGGFLNIIFKPETVSSTKSFLADSSRIVHDISSTSAQSTSWVQTSLNTVGPSAAGETPQLEISYQTRGLSVAAETSHSEIPDQSRGLSAAEETSQSEISDQTHGLSLKISRASSVFGLSMSWSIISYIHGAPDITTTHLSELSVLLTSTQDLTTTKTHLTSMTLSLHTQQKTKESLKSPSHPLISPAPTTSRTWQITPAALSLSPYTSISSSDILSPFHPPSSLSSTSPLTAAASANEELPSLASTSPITAAASTNEELPSLASTPPITAASSANEELPSLASTSPITAAASANEELPLSPCLTDTLIHFHSSLSSTSSLTVAASLNENLLSGELSPGVTEPLLSGELSSDERHVRPSDPLGRFSLSHSSHIGIITSSAPGHQIFTATPRFSLQSAMLSKVSASPCPTVKCTTASVGESTKGPIRKHAPLLCRCYCARADSLLEQQQQQQHDAVKSELSLDTTSLSSSVRKRMSVPDERTSASALGTGAVVFIVLILAFLTAGDLLYLCAYLAAPRRYRTIM